MRTLSTVVLQEIIYWSLRKLSNAWVALFHPGKQGFLLVHNVRVRSISASKRLLNNVTFSEDDNLTRQLSAGFRFRIKDNRKAFGHFTRIYRRVVPSAISFIL